MLAVDTDERQDTTVSGHFWPWPVLAAQRYREGVDRGLVESRGTQSCHSGAWPWHSPSCVVANSAKARMYTRRCATYSLA